MVKCVVFDIGNVLWHYQPFHNELFSVWGKRVNLSRKELYAEFEQVYKGFEKGKGDYQTWLASLNGGVVPEKAQKELNKLIDKHFSRHLNNQLLDFIPKLKNKHKIVGCLSNTENFIKRFHLKLDKKVDFDFQILSYQVGARKPEKEIYQEIFKYVDFEPTEVLFIDDKKENVQGAREVGLNARHYTNSDKIISQLEKIGS